MASISNTLSLKHGLSLGCPQSTPLNRIHRDSCSFPSRSFRRCFTVSASSFANENREFVIVGGGNSAGYAARTFVEHGMASGKLCIVSKEAYAPYERPALTKAYLFPLDKKPARLPGFHTCVGTGGERQTPDWYKEQGIEMLYEDPIVNVDTEKQTLKTNSGKLLKYGSLIIATGCSASRFPDKIGGNLPGVHYIRDVADADSLISSLEKAKKVVVVGGGYIGMEVAAATSGWNLDTTVVLTNEEDFGDEWHEFLLLGVQYRYVITKKDRPPWLDHIFEDKLQLSLLSFVEFRYLVIEKDRPPWHDLEPFTSDSVQHSALSTRRGRVFLPSRES